MGQTHALLVGLPRPLGRRDGDARRGDRLVPDRPRRPRPPADPARGRARSSSAASPSDLVNAGAGPWDSRSRRSSPRSPPSASSTGSRSRCGRRPAASIDRDFTAWLATGLGPVPVAFIVVVVGAVALDYWLHATGSGLQAALDGVRRAVGEAQRRPNDLGARPGVGPVGSVRGRRVVLRHDAVRDRQRADRRQLRAQQHHRRGARRGRAVRRAGDVHRRRRSRRCSWR